jgi:hypothetical protein
MALSEPCSHFESILETSKYVAVSARRGVSAKGVTVESGSNFKWCFFA